MKTKPIETTELKELFKKNVVMDMDDLIKQTASSRTTILRRLKEMGYITSYNHNGKYFAIPGIIDFDESGLFEHKGIRFFKDGGIQELAVSQIDSSEKGYTTEELSEKIKTRVSNQLRIIAEKGLISRKKYSDFYVYFSIKEPNQKNQIDLREKEINIKSIKEEIEPSDEKKIIRILLEIIRNPNIIPEDIGKRLREDGLKISDDFIKNIFDKYEIQKKGFQFSF